MYVWFWGFVLFNFNCSVVLYLVFVVGIVLGLVVFLVLGFFFAFNFNSSVMFYLVFVVGIVSIVLGFVVGLVLVFCFI